MFGVPIFLSVCVLSIMHVGPCSVKDVMSGCGELSFLSIASKALLVESVIELISTLALHFPYDWSMAVEGRGYM